MDVGAVLPVFLEGVRPVALSDAAREGRILEARVTAMLTNTLARLAIGGETINVATPKPLPVGAMLTLKAERQGGELRLITQGPIRVPVEQLPTAVGGAQALPDVLIEPVNTLLAKVQALAVEAMLAEQPAQRAAAPPPDLAALLNAPPETRPGRHTPPGVTGDTGPPAEMLAAALDAASDAAPGSDKVRGDAPLARPEITSPHAAAADLAGGAARSDRAIHFNIDLPIAFPGHPGPLRLEVERDDGEADGDDHDSPRAPSWTIRFAAEAGRLGMIHAAIALISGQVGVQLWAERAEAAALFNESAPQLKDALRASDLRLEALTIAEGRPSRPRLSDEHGTG